MSLALWIAIASGTGCLFLVWVMCMMTKRADEAAEAAQEELNRQLRKASRIQEMNESSRDDEDAL